MMMEREKLQGLTPKGKIPMQHAGAEHSVVVMKAL